MSITYRSNAAVHSLTIKMNGKSSVVDLSGMDKSKAAAYVNRLRKWRKEGEKGFPPSP